MFTDLYFTMIPPPPKSTLFPYTTLFRSSKRPIPRGEAAWSRSVRVYRINAVSKEGKAIVLGTADTASQALKHVRDAIRSEEHTSELQSHVNLVCRLLLEKKKIDKYDV